MTTHELASAAATAVPFPTRIELASRASRRMRVMHAFARRTIRPLLDLCAELQPIAPALVPPFLWLSSNFELLGKALVPVRGTTCRPLDFGDFTAEWVWHGDQGPEDPVTGAILYCHGGGFLFGGLHSHRRLVSRLARATGLPVLNVDYRQLPEATIRESQADALAAYRQLLASGVPADRILFAGDSAGGGLVLSTAIAARGEGLPLPAGIATICPLAELDPAARREHPNNRTDAVLSAKSVAAALRLGLPDDDPAYSPLHHGFAGLPPMLIQVSGTEVFLPDAEAMFDRCTEAGVPCQLQIWDGAVHVFHAFADLAPEGHRAIANMAHFCQSLLVRGERMACQVKAAA